MKKLTPLKRIASYIKPYRIAFCALLLFAIVSVVLSTALPYVAGLPATEIAKNLAAGQGVNFAYVFQCLVWIALVGIGYSLTQLLAGILVTNVVQQAMKDLRTDIERKINCLPVAYFDQNQQGDILSRVTNDVDALSGALQQSLIAIVNAVLGIGLSVAMMFYINVTMAWMALVMIPTSFLLSQGIVKFSQRYFQKMQNSLGELNGYVQENLTGFSVLKVYGREEQTLAGFKKVNHDLKNYGFKAAFISGLMTPLVQLTAYLTYVVIAIVGSLNVISGVIVLGQLQAFIQYIWQISQPMGNITQLSGVIQSAAAATQRIFEILDTPEEEADGELALPPKVSGKVIFENVSFGYQPEKPLIQNLNVTVEAGQTVAIVGPTGAGKTTLINLLLRFYDVDQGAIKIDGVDTQKMSRSEVRSLFGMVLQDAWLYEGSIAENIRFGQLEATDYEVVDAAKTANVDHFIRTMPDGYDMQINAEADNISLGQKQLLTIARAVIANPKILILDEATSSVDTRLEALIQKAMEQVMHGRTSFVIAHRLSTIREADLILVLDQGAIIEQGTHETLLAQGGFYQKLYQSQFSNQ
ncbi:MAG: ABC transporter ATP-binding protein [Enterococcus sp.]